MIVIEGLDNTGKTTLYEELASVFPQLHPRPSIGNKHDRGQIQEQAYKEAFLDDPLMLGDRSRIISEYIYNPILKRRDIAYSFDTYMGLLAEYVRGRHLVIWCRHWQEFDDREQLDGVEDHLDELIMAYEETMTMLRFLFRVSGGGSQLIQYYYHLDGSLFAVKAQVLNYLGGVK